MFILGQIDWAALAQAWIAQREASGQQSVVEQQGMMPNGQDISGIESGPNNHNNFQGDPNFNRMWQPGLFSFPFIPFFSCNEILFLSDIYGCEYALSLRFQGAKLPVASTN